MAHAQLGLSFPGTDREPVNDLDRRYREWITANPAVFRLFERFAMEKMNRRLRFGVRALTERVRWEISTTWEKDAAGFKINNNALAYLARDLLHKHPDLAALLETRQVDGEEEDGAPTRNGHGHARS